VPPTLHAICLPQLNFTVESDWKFRYLY